MADDKKLTTRAADFSAWYNETVLRAELADYSPVRGCMVIRPRGYGIWERMQRQLDFMFKDTGHENAYFPMLIPESFMHKEAEHVEGFSPELAVVTHGGGKNSKSRSSSVQHPRRSSTRCLQNGCRVIATCRFSSISGRTSCDGKCARDFSCGRSEFLWQEGHTAHVSEAEAEEEARKMLGVYRDFMEGWMAMPVITGIKTDSERFAGALRTWACEAMMQDNKALQAGTTHNLGQNFSKAFDLKFQTETGGMDYAWNTSWGVSTRLVGGLVMTHGDDFGLRTPPFLAPVELVIVPIWRTDEDKSRVLEAARVIRDTLSAWERRKTGKLRVHLDDREGMKPGAKYYEWELRGIPLRLEFGPRDLDQNQCVLVRATIE